MDFTWIASLPVALHLALADERRTGRRMAGQHRLFVRYAFVMCRLRASVRKPWKPSSQSARLTSMPSSTALTEPQPCLRLRNRP